MQRTVKNRIFILSVATLAVVATGCDKLKARDKLNKGVQAYKAGQFDVAIEDFKQAKDLDPNLTNAGTYLATAYASQYIPGAPSDENVNMGKQAIAEFQEVLKKDPVNLSAIDGIGSILWSMGSNPFNEKTLDEAKQYQLKHIQIKPDDAEPYYWIAVIDWAIAFRHNNEMRDDYNRTAKKTIRETDPMPPKLAAQYQQKYGELIQEGMDYAQKAMDRKQQYDDAMAYLSLLYRRKADTETSPQAQDADNKQADDLVHKVQVIKQQREANPSTAPSS
jgi:tetratricopeptide (TPR) repeat protein